jgi:hypothetical protein
MSFQGERGRFEVKLASGKMGEAVAAPGRKAWVTPKIILGTASRNTLLADSTPSDGSATHKHS